MDFKNKVVVVTGASSGIGAETARQFATLSANLVLTGRNEENLKSLAADCLKANKDSIPLVLVGDLCDEQFVAGIIDETIKKFNKIDVLVNNAGVLENGSIETTSLDQLDRVMNVNVRAVYQLTNLAVPHLIKSKGNIVNVSSVVGLRAFPNVLAYCMSKAALDQFTRCIALELATKGVRVNSVNPGVVVTNLHKRAGMDNQQYDEFVERCKTTQPLGRAGNVEEVAKSILFLASDNASFITAATLPVDGGKHALCPR